MTLLLGPEHVSQILGGAAGGCEAGRLGTGPRPPPAPGFSLRITLLLPSHHLCLFSFILTTSPGFAPSCFYTSFSLAGIGILLPSSPRGPPSHNSGLLSGSPSPAPLPSRGPEAPFLPGLCLVKPQQSRSALSKVLPLLTTWSPARSWQLLGSSSCSSSCTPLLVPPGGEGRQGQGESGLVSGYGKRPWE